MSVTARLNRRSAAGELERELLARLGLAGAVGEADIERAHDDLVAFLEGAPHDLRAWANGQIASADEAYALLSNPAARELTPDTPKPVAAEEARPRRATNRQERQLPPDALRTRRQLGPLARIAAAAAVVIVVLGVGYVVYTSDTAAVPGISGTPAPEGSQPVLDTAKVAELMGKIQANPNDTASLQALGDEYFFVGDYATAAEWERKVLAITPDDVNAHLALGAALFNQGDAAGAATEWQAAVAIDPQNAEAHYDLGFMYFSQNPPDVERTIAEWQKVVDIDPGSDLANTVSAHLDTLKGWQASNSPAAATPAASGASALPSPAASATPAGASTAPSAGPSTNP